MAPKYSPPRIKALAMLSSVSGPIPGKGRYGPWTGSAVPYRPPESHVQPRYYPYPCFYATHRGQLGPYGLRYPSGSTPRSSSSSRSRLISETASGSMSAEGCKFARFVLTGLG